MVTKFLHFCRNHISYFALCHVEKVNTEVFIKCFMSVLNLIKYALRFIKFILKVWRKE